MCCHAEFKEDGECVFVWNDNFANCDSMFRRKGPRRCLWGIAIVSLVGAVFVLVWRTLFKEKNVAQTIMLMHVAVADGLMGVYLFIIGAKDAMWSGEYYLHDYQWRTGLSCQITGGICVLSSEVSLMILSLLSADRFKHIVFPRRFRTLGRKKTHTFCFIIWAISFLIAFLPTFGITYFHDPANGILYYGKSVMCLPLQLHPDFISGWEYSVAFFVGLNLFLVLFIIVAYAMILGKTCLSKRRLNKQGTKRARKARAKTANTKREKSLTKRVLFIILTDCACWMPIIVFGLRSTLENGFDVPGDLSVWIAVFVLPINSAINPFLYTFSTREVCNSSICFLFHTRYKTLYIIATIRHSRFVHDA